MEKANEMNYPLALDLSPNRFSIQPLALPSCKRCGNLGKFFG
jgi:hypothetical protein